MSALWFAPSCLLLLLLLLPPRCGSATLGEPDAPAVTGCLPCAPAKCPALPARGCPLGKVRDGCGCCWQCARGEGEACGAGTPSGPAAGWGRCAAGLECRRRRKGQAGACACKSRYPVCGSDGLTYPSVCQLRAASLRAESRGERPVGQRNKGPCEQGTSSQIHTPNACGSGMFLFASSESACSGVVRAVEQCRLSWCNSCPNMTGCKYSTNILQFVELCQRNTNHDWHFLSHGDDSVASDAWKNSLA
ncbi:hypothetical protein lerEdw1_009051 [Lerista edwardsae]|nr:hypothetical protein lerEdw1_009051 [Lerista edwardsae]